MCCIIVILGKRCGHLQETCNGHTVTRFFHMKAAGGHAGASHQKQGLSCSAILLKWCMTTEVLNYLSKFGTVNVYSPS